MVVAGTVRDREGFEESEKGANPVAGHVAGAEAAAMVVDEQYGVGADDAPDQVCCSLGAARAAMGAQDGMLREQIEQGALRTADSVIVACGAQERRSGNENEQVVRGVAEEPREAETLEVRRARASRMRAAPEVVCGLSLFFMA